MQKGGELNPPRPSFLPPLSCQRVFTLGLFLISFAGKNESDQADSIRWVLRAARIHAIPVGHPRHAAPKMAVVRQTTPERSQPDSGRARPAVSSRHRKTKKQKKDTNEKKTKNKKLIKT